MKKILSATSILLFNLLFSQYVTLSKAVKTSDNKDKFFYLIENESSNAEYLGEVEVQGFSANDPEVFSQIYKKAKSIGANSFSLRKRETIEGTSDSFDPAHYYLNLYYVESFPKEDNVVFVISSADKTVKARINNKIKEFPPRSFYKLNLQPGAEHSLVSGGFLGSKIKMMYKQGQPSQYFQLLPAGIRADQSGYGSLNIKSGDIILVEKSYAQFLTTIYKEVK